MKILNVRYGFATNSSSIHSIVLLSKPAYDNYDNQDFGWDFFTLSSEKAKRIYLAQCLKNQFIRNNNLESEDALILAANWSGLSIDELDKEGHVDHQSIIHFPLEKSWFNKPKISKKFFNDLLNYIIQPNISILGGNDNSFNKHPLLNNNSKIINKYKYNGEYEHILEALSEESNIRYDNTGKFWTIFDKRTGKKVRMTFDGTKGEKSEAPELVDMKITDYCNKNCSFCYQDSTTKGKHADLDIIHSMINSLHYLNVFEIALGGGEPTSHPEFINILKYIDSYGIIANFTSKNIDWIVKNYDDIKKYVGGIGISVSDDIFLLRDLSKLYSLDNSKFTIQVPVGVCDEETLENILNLCNQFNFTVLLLGWKK